jgi:hypothetical protein
MDWETDMRFPGSVSMPQIRCEYGHFLTNNQESGLETAFGLQTPPGWRVWREESSRDMSLPSGARNLPLGP